MSQRGPAGLPEPPKGPQNPDHIQTEKAPEQNNDRKSDTKGKGSEGAGAPGSTITRVQKHSPLLTQAHAQERGRRSDGSFARCAQLPGW